MKKFVSIIMTLCMLASLVMIPVMAEENAVITSILGSREAVNVYFDNAVTVTEASVSDMAGNMFRCTYSFDSTQKRLLVKLGSLMDLTKKYILTVKTENAVYEKYLEFETLVNDDFSDDEAYKNYTMSDWGTNKGGTLVSHNASHTEENLLIGSGIDSLTYSKANSGYDSWKDYTVEFDYITQTGKVANNIGIFFYSKFTYWVTQLYHGYHGIFISTDDSKTHYVKPYSNSYSYSRDNTAITGVQTTGDKTKFGNSNLRVSASTFGRDVMLNIRNADTKELLMSKQALVPVSMTSSNINRTSGMFAINVSASNIATGSPIKIDNLVCYKMKSSDVDFTPSITNGSKDLYNVNEITFNWKNELDSFSETNVVIETEDGVPYTDFSVNYENKISTITFNASGNNPLAGETKYKISFTGLTSGTTPVTTYTYSFTTGGIYKELKLTAENKIPVGETTTISVVGVTESGAEFPLDANLEFLGNDEVVAVTDSGVVTAKAKGTETITVTYADPNTQNPYLENGKLYAYIDITAYLLVDSMQGDRNKVSMLFKGPVNVLQAYFSDCATNEVIEAEFAFDAVRNKLDVIPAKSLDLAKKYIITVVADDATYEKYVSFEIFEQDEFSASDAYSKWTHSGWTEEKGGTFANKNIANTEENLLIPSGIESAGYNGPGYSEYINWKDYTVEFEYITDAEKPANAFRVFLYSKYSYWVAQSHKYYGAYIGTGAEDAKYVTPNPGATNGQGTDNVAIENAVTTGGTTKFNEGNLTVSASLTGRDLYMNIRNKATDEVLFTKSAYIPVEMTTDKIHMTGGTFGIHASATGASTGEALKIDNLKVYKMKYAEIEYAPSISFNARDLYDVTDVTLDWNYDVNDITASNITITETNAVTGVSAPYTNFGVSHSDGITTITFNTPLQGEHQYEITYNNVTTNTETLTPMPLSFFMGGIYTGIEIAGATPMAVGGNGLIHVEGTTTTNSTYTIENENIVYTSDKPEIISVDAEGKLKALDRGCATITAVFTDNNPSSLGTNGKFTATCKVYSTMDEIENVTYSGTATTANPGKVADLGFKNGVVMATFTDDSVKDLYIGFGGTSVALTTDGTNYKVGNQTIPRTAGTHSVEILKNEGTISVYLDGVEVYTQANVEATAVYAGGSMTVNDISVHNLIGNVCEATFVTVRDNGNLYGEYFYDDKDNYKADGTKKDPETDAELNSSYQWYVSTDGSSFSPITGATSRTLNKASYIGSYVKFEVTPANKYEQGAAVMSSSYKVEATVGGNDGGTGGGNGGGGGGGGSASTNKNNSSESTDSFAVSAPTHSMGAIDESVKIVYKDVTAGHWAYNAISNLTVKEVLTGFEDGSFKPEEKVTRAQFICALIKIEEPTFSEYVSQFTDVADDAWYKNYVQTANDLGYVFGSDGKFYPDSYITREEMATIIARVYTKYPVGDIPFADAQYISDWACDAVGKLTKAGILNGKGDNIFDPKGLATRAEMAVIFDRITQQ